MLHPDVGGQRIAGLRSHAQQRRELRHGRGDHARIRPQCGQDPFPQLGQLIFRLGQQQPTQCVKRLKDAVELQILPILVERAGHEPAIVTGHRPAQLINQRRFPHPRCPTDQHTATSSRQRILKRSTQRDQLVVAADEPRRRQQAQRKVALTDPRCSPCRRTVFGQPRNVVDSARPPTGSGRRAPFPGDA